MDITWAQVVNSSLPLLGVIVGGIVTYKTQTTMLKKQFESELEKEREKNNVERLKVYSEVLKLEGANIMYEYAGQGADFNLKVFNKEFRPVLFTKFYLLHQEIAEIVRKMDMIVAEANFEEQLTRRHNDLLLNNFNKLISIIERQMKDYRENL